MTDKRTLITNKRQAWEYIKKKMPGLLIMMEGHWKGCKVWIDVKER